MANRNFRDPKVLEPGVVILAGTVTHGADTVASQTGDGFTVTKGGGTGDYLITLANQYPEMLGCFLQLETDDATSDKQYTVTTPTMSARTITFQTRKSSDGAAVAAASGDKVHIMIILKNSGVLH